MHRARDGLGRCILASRLLDATTWAAPPKIEYAGSIPVGATGAALGGRYVAVDSPCLYLPDVGSNPTTLSDVPRDGPRAAACFGARHNLEDL